MYDCCLMISSRTPLPYMVVVIIRALLNGESPSGKHYNTWLPTGFIEIGYSKELVT